MSRLETWRYGLCPGGVMEIVDMFGDALTICQYYLSLQQGSASKFKPEVHVAAVMHQACPSFWGDWGGGIGMGGLSKVRSLLNPQVFQADFQNSKPGLLPISDTAPANHTSLSSAW